MKPTILVVDDDHDTLWLVQTMLAGKGFSVVTARGGAEALEMVQRSAPALILLDVMMPEMSGYEVLARLKTNRATSRVPVILVTAKGHDDDVMTGYQHGADYYITKPYTSKQLLFGVELVLDRADLPVAEKA
jgi:DNA-binding response OmpR family regulator